MVSPEEEASYYTVPTLAHWLHFLPHLNVTFRQVNNSFDPHSPVYLESLGILGSVPAAWLILTLLVLLIYLLTRCCDRKPRPSRSISALKVSLAIVSVLCCAAIGLGLYGNDDLHNGFMELLQQGKEVDELVDKIRNQTQSIEKLLRSQAGDALMSIREAFDQPVINFTLYANSLDLLQKTLDNNTIAANAAADIRRPLISFNLVPDIQLGEKIEELRWPATMAVLSVLLILCVILLVGVARHSRWALIAFSVCGLLAVIASYLMASVYLAASVALADLCMAPDKYIEDQATTILSKEILRYYTSCERAGANPFTQRILEAKKTIENMRVNLEGLKQPTLFMYPKKALDAKFSSLKNEVYAADKILSSLTPSVDCPALHSHYVRGARALCNEGLLGLTSMLVSSILAGILLTALVWVDSHTWIYIRKKKDYHQVNETDSYLPPPAASQAIAARTLQRSQGSSYPPDTPPPSYTYVLMHRSHASAPPLLHEAQSDGCDMRPPEHYRGGGGGGVGGGGAVGGVGAHMSHLRGHTLGRLPSHHHEPALPGPNNGKPACKEFPNFKGFKFDQRQPQASISKQQQQQPRTANIQKFSSLGRRPLPQTPDEKARKQPAVPKVPTPSTICETPLNPANFRSLQRGAWQDGYHHHQHHHHQQQQHQPQQFRSLQRGATSAPQFRGAKIQDQTHEAVYANNENERQLYAVTEL